MSNPTRILQVIGSMNCGGAENMIMNLYRKVDKSIVQFDFVVWTNKKAFFDDEIISLGGRIYRCPHYVGKNHFAYTKWWNEFLNEHKGEYTVIHGHLGSTAAIYLSIAKKYGLYTIAHSHSTKSHLIFNVYNYPTRFIADYFLGCSQAAAATRYGKRIANNKNICKILNNAIDTQKFVFNQNTRKEIRKSLLIGDGVKVFGHVGRFDEVKNHIFLLTVFKQILKTYPESILILLGDGHNRTQIEKFISDNNMQKNVLLAGVRSNVNEFLQAIDVIVMPSLYEGLPVSLIEAQAASLPCCLSDTITKEVALTDNIKFLSLDSSPEIWAKTAIEMSDAPRCDMSQIIINSGYDIDTTARWLQEFYIEKNS